MGAVTHPPTSSELLDHALAHQAPHLVKVLVRALDLVEEFGELAPDFTGPDDLLRQLAAAIDRRVYVAKKHHDEQIAAVLDDAASRIRARYTAERETLERLDEASAGDADPQTDDGPGAPPAASTADLSVPAGAGEATPTPGPSSPCRHEESLYGRCVACGLTWEQQAAAVSGG